MKISRQATKGHFIAGIILVVLSGLSLLGSVLLDLKLAAFLTFFFGVWGGVELGRYLEHSLTSKTG